MFKSVLGVPEKNGQPAKDINWISAIKSTNAQPIFTNHASFYIDHLVVTEYRRRNSPRNIIWRKEGMSHCYFGSLKNGNCVSLIFPIKFLL